MAIDYFPTSDFPAKETETNQEAERINPKDDVVYKTKEIEFRGRKKHIILQNENGPCPLIAICNILILRNDMFLYPCSSEEPESRLLKELRETLICANKDYDFSEDACLSENLPKNVSDAIDLLPNLADGINVNVKFKRINDFELTPEIEIFRLLDICYYHGWIVDPQDIETARAIGCKSYNDLTTALVALETQTLKSQRECSVDLSAANTAALGECSKTRSSADSPPSSAEHRNSGEGEIEQNIPLLLRNLESSEKEKLGFDIWKSSSSEGESDTLETSVATGADCTGTTGSGICQKSKSDDQLSSTDSEDKTDCNVVNKINVGEEVYSTSSITKSSVALEHDQVSSTELGDETVVDVETENDSKMTAVYVTSPEAISEEKTKLESTEDDSISEIPLNSEVVTIANPDFSGRSHDEDEGDNYVSLGSPADEGESLHGESSLEESDTNALTPLEGEVIRSFLNDNATQLTYHGLLSLIQDVREGQLCVFFRNNHFSTMLKYQGELYLLVTDQGYLTQPDLVWEKLNEVNGDSVFMTGDFKVFNSDSSESRKWDQQHAGNSSTIKRPEWDQRQAVSNITDHIFNMNISSKHDLENDPDLKMAMELQQQELVGRSESEELQQEELGGRSDSEVRMASSVQEVEQVLRWQMKMYRVMYVMSPLHISLIVSACCSFRFFPSKVGF